MPHLIMEVSDNIAPREELTEILAQLHEMVGAMPTVDIEALKSRLVERTIFFVGSKGRENRFIDCTLDILPAGRSPEWRRKVGTDMLNKLKECSKNWNSDKSKLSINVEIRDLSEYYFR